MTNRLWIIPALICSASAMAATDTIYVQASRGSFNDAAIHKLFSQSPHLQSELEFSGTPTNAFQRADEQNALAFVAVANSTIDGKLVQATVDAMEQYQVTELKGFITTPIEMCVLMNSKDVASEQPITLLASHPAALKQINGWKATVQAKELEVPEGTAAAAKKVSEQELPAGTAAVGACVLDSAYPDLSIVARGVQDNKNNRTSFILADVAKREAPIDEEQARVVLQQVIDEGIKLYGENLQ
ncbi:prephenate dehydratase domain-containing protein [Oceanimonas baumannii]|uniref:prephenate dehydratase domain-containing protein n=1 Tax=Oceanimonas baumannii TaxID=129578 RepID=UPI003A8E1975